MENKVPAVYVGGGGECVCGRSVCVGECMLVVGNELVALPNELANSF